MTSIGFGIDIGGSGIKGAPVELEQGRLAGERLRIPTPRPATPQAVAATVRALVDAYEVPFGVPVGVTFPAVIQQGIARTAANVDDAWIGTDVDALLSEETGHDVFVVNDADAAGVAEMEFGAGRGMRGVVLLTTLGTGVGSALFVDGHLVPNSELGHLPLHGDSAERYMAESVREREDLDWETWAGRLQEYYAMVQALLNPDLIIVGGGVSKHHEQFLPRLDLRCPIVPARSRNEAGIIGAAVLAHHSELALQKAERKRAAKKAKKARKAAEKHAAKGAKKAGKKARKARAEAGAEEALGGPAGL